MTLVVVVSLLAADVQAQNNGDIRLVNEVENGGQSVETVTLPILRQ